MWLFHRHAEMVPVIFTEGFFGNLAIHQKCRAGDKCVTRGGDHHCCTACRLHGIFANTSLLPNLIVNNIKVIIIKCEKKKKGETDVENSSISLLQWLTILESLCLILSSSI